MNHFRFFLSVIISIALVIPPWTPSEVTAGASTQTFFADQALSGALVLTIHPYIKKVASAVRKKASWDALEAHLNSPESRWTHLATWPVGLLITVGSLLLPCYGYSIWTAHAVTAVGLTMTLYRRLLQNYGRHGGPFPYYISVRDPLRDILEWLVVQSMYATYPFRTGRTSHSQHQTPTRNRKMVILSSYPKDFLVPWKINAHMNPKGERVNRIKAARQWEALTRQLVASGVEVIEIPMEKSLADMVFTANGGTVSVDVDGHPIFIPPQFTEPVRQGETAVFTEFMKNQGYRIVDATLNPELSSSEKTVRDPYEGDGDALTHYDDVHGVTRFGGYGDPTKGFRSNVEAQKRVAKALGQRFVGLELVDPNFYHLDTAFCPLNDGRSVMYYPEAFSAESQALIEKYVTNPIRLTKEEAAVFSANAIPVGNKVFLNKVLPSLREKLNTHGFKAIETPMSEFMKSGGSCKCTALFLSVMRASSKILSPVSGAIDEFPESSFYNGVLAHRQHAAKARDREKYLASLIKPVRDITAQFTFLRDDGSWYPPRTGWRRLSGEPGKGGTRSEDGTVQADVAALNLDMDTKIPEGITVEGHILRGGKGGMNINFKTLSRSEKIRAIRAYVDAMMDAVWLHEHKVAFGPLFDVPAPDVGTSLPDVNLMDYFADEALRWQVEHADVIMPWLTRNDRQMAEDLRVLVDNHVELPSELDLTYAKRVMDLREQGNLNSHRLLATVTGKSLEYGGIAGRSTSTGLGMAYALFEFMKAKGLISENADRIPHNIKIAVEGFGNVGYGAAIAFLDIGIQLSAIKEFDKKNGAFAFYAPKGFDRPLIEALKLHQKEFGTIYDFTDPRVTRIDATQFWTLDVDIFAPSAKEEAIDETQANLIRPGKIIVEGANGATTPAADLILREKEIVVIPDVVANSGGVLVSWMEIVQNIIPNEEPWLERNVNEYLHHLVETRMIPLVEYAITHGDLTLREAAHEISMELRLRPLLALQEAA